MDLTDGAMNSTHSGAGKIGADPRKRGVDARKRGVDAQKSGVDPRKREAKVPCIAVDPPRVVVNPARDSQETVCTDRERWFIAAGRTDIWATRGSKDGGHGPIPTTQRPPP